MDVKLATSLNMIVIEPLSSSAASIDGLTAVRSASKFAVAGLSEGLSQELAPLGIQELCVFPTLVRTEMFTPDVMARMPGAAATFIEPDEFARRSLRELATGRVEAVIPPHMKGPIILNTLFPAWMGRMVGRVELAALREAGFEIDS